MVILVFFLFMLNGALSQGVKAPAASNSILMGNGNLKSGVYALLVGINKYENLDNLRYAEKDVRDFAIFLNEVFNENLKLDTLTNNASKFDKIMTSIGHAQNKDFGEFKKAYLLFSVHGGQKTVNDKEVYLFVDQNYDPKDNMGKGLFRMKYLKNLVDLFTNEGVMVILILDACHAGNINPQKIHQTINSWNNDKISVKFLACLEDEKAHESDSLQNGILTHYFLKGARSEANSDANDTIDVNEMRKYLIRKVADEALKTNKKQTPLIIGKDSLIITVLNKKDKIQPLKAVYTDTESAVNTDSLKNIEDSFKKSLEKEELNDAFNWLMQYKAHDSVSLSYHQLKYKYISTCYNVSVDLSEKLVGLTLNSFTLVKNSALFKSTDIFTHATVSNRLGVIENLKKCLTLLKITEPFYEEINYRLLIVEGFKQKDIKKIDNAIQINPDFAYPYLFLAYINCKNENYADCIKDLEEYKRQSGDNKMIDEVISAVEGLRKKEATPKKPLPDSWNGNYMVEMVTDEKNNLKAITLKITGIGKTKEEAALKSGRNAVAAVLFKGIPGSSISSPLLGSETEMLQDKYKPFFDEFFSPKGDYSRFVNMFDDIDPKDINKIRKVGYEVAGTAVVNYGQLRQYFEDKGIVRGFGSF